MAGPSILVRVLGDMSGLSKSFGDAQGKGKSAASSLHASFSSALGALNQTGVLGPFQGALDGVDQAITQISNHSKNLGAAMIGVGGAVAGVGLGLQQMGSKEQASHQQLQAAIGATGKSYDEYAGKIEATIKHQENFGHSSAETQDALRTLTQATGDPQKALNLMGEAADLAAAKHESLTEAAGQLAKASAGGGRIMKEFGIANKDAAGNVVTNNEKLTELAGKLSGQASAATSTFSGKIDALKTKAEDAVAQFGSKWGPAITAVGAAMTGAGAAIEVTKVATSALKDQQILATTWSGLVTAATWLWNAALDANPVMIVVLATAALVAGFILAYQHIAIFRAVVDDMGKAVAAVFNAIVGAASACFNWLANNWPLVLAILAGPFGLALYEIIGHWGDIEGFLRSLPGRVAGAVGGMWNGISNAFKSVLNDVIDLWNRLHFTTPSVDVFGAHIGGEQIGMPQIPHLAQGGLITASGLVYAHAGEAITPMPAGGLGPAVHIENAKFGDELDVETFMRRVAWVTSTKRT